MPIAALDAFPVSYPEPNDHGRNRAVCLVRLTDGDGRTGWGECTTYWPEAAVAAAVLVEALRGHVVGKDAVQNESIMRGLRAQTWWYGTGGVGIAGFALSGLDVALWDLKGKILGARVLDLLGGPATRRCRPSPPATPRAPRSPRWPRRSPAGWRPASRA